MKITVTPFAIELKALDATMEPDAPRATIVVEDNANLRASILHNAK